MSDRAWGFQDGADADQQGGSTAAAKSSSPSSFFLAVAASAAARRARVVPSLPLFLPRNEGTAGHAWNMMDLEARQSRLRVESALVSAGLGPGVADSDSAAILRRNPGLRPILLAMLTDLETARVRLGELRGMRDVAVADEICFEGSMVGKIRGGRVAGGCGPTDMDSS